MPDRDPVHGGIISSGGSTAATRECGLLMSDQAQSPTPPATHRRGIRWYALVLSVAQIALLLLGSWSMWIIAGGWWLGIVAAALFAGVWLGIWAILLVPGSSRRLTHKDRFTVQLVGGTIIVVIASLAGPWIPALVATSMAIMCDALNEGNPPQT